ncbi:MAG: GntR family transcriptional regulator [Armatimonadota bacterium]|nr:GntR family transcriptional regulator [Armatimonadota bacterium]
MPEPTLPAITFEDLTERVCHSLRDAIINGMLQPGERLVEERIAAQLGVSRAPVREALQVLETEGLVTSVPRRGVSVTVLTKGDVEEIYGLRSALECQAARGACRNASIRDFEYLRSLVQEIKRSSPRDAKLLAAPDIAFHRRILELSGNRRLLDAWLSIMSQVRLLQRHVLASRSLSVENLARNHEAIVDALQSGDADTAERCLREHIERTGHEVFASFPESRAEPGSALRRSAGRRRKVAK